MSKFTFVGTGAADWPVSDKSFYKDFFTNREARMQQRKFSCAIYKDILIDCGKMAFELLCEQQQDFSKLSHIIITHSHPDHFDAFTLSQLCTRIFPVQLTIWGVKDLEVQLPVCKNLTFHCIECFKPFEIGAMRITAVPSNHWVVETGEQTVNFLIQDIEEDKTIFYGLDGAGIPIISWNELSKYKYDLIVLECTTGCDENDKRAFSHNNVTMVKILAGALRAYKVLKPEGRIYVSHIAATLHKSHKELQTQLNEIDVIVAQDGLCIEI